MDLRRPLHVLISISQRSIRLQTTKKLSFVTKQRRKLILIDSMGDKKLLDDRSSGLSYAFFKGLEHVECHKHLGFERFTPLVLFAGEEHKRDSPLNVPTHAMSFQTPNLQKSETYTPLSASQTFVLIIWDDNLEFS